MSTNYKKMFSNFRRFLAAFAVLAIMLFALEDASAQGFHSKMKNYTNATFTAAFQSIVGQPGTTNLGYGPYPYYSFPYYYSTIALPFNFSYDSVQRFAGATVYLHNNGCLSFQYTGNYDYGYSCSNGYQTSFPDYINAWGILYYPYNFSSGIYSQVVGLAGSRVWTLEYPNVSTYYSGSTVSVQIKLYEANSSIEFLYSTNNKNMSYGYVGDIGLNGSVNGNYTGYDNTYYYFTYKNPFFTPPTQLRFSPKAVTNIQLSVQPKILNFGALQTGISSAPQCVTVKNAGTFGDLNITSATITGGSDFTFTSIPPSNTYVVGASDQYCIKFTPSQPGVRIATLVFGSNGKDSASQSVSLSGIGTIAEYTIDSLVRFKKTRTRFGDSLTQYLHITSTGVQPLFFSGFNLLGQDAGQYFISYLPTSPMPTGKVDSIGITYVPTIEGKHVATLRLLSNSFSRPSLDISLQGTGILPHIVLTPAILQFDSTVREGDTVCKTITIWNPGTDTLKILKNFLSSNDGDFHYFGLTGTDTLIAPDHTKIVTVCFSPKQQGSRQARLLLVTNIINTFETPRRDTARIVTVDIRGTGIPFGVFSNAVSGSPFLDSAVVGVEVCRTDTLKNTGDADILVTGFTFTGGGFRQTGLPTPPFMLKARTSIVFILCGTPDKQGLITGTLVFNGKTSGTSIAYGIPLGIYGLNSCATPTPGELFTAVVLPNNGSDSSQCVWVHNCGEVSASYTGAVSGLKAADYTITSQNPSRIVASGDSVQFCVTYKPSVVGTSNAVLNFTSPTAPNVDVPLNGAAGCAQLAAEVASVPNTGANGVNTFTFKITNTGTTPWTAGAAVVVGTGKDAYKVISVSPDPILPGQDGIVTMEFHPAVGTEGDNFIAVVSWPNGGPCENAVVSVDLNGKSVVSSVTATTASDGFILDQSYPNPSAGMTNFTYTTPREAEVRITLVDLTGKLIRTLITGRVSEGTHSVYFDAQNLPSGSYVYVLESGSTRLSRQLILTK